MIHNMQVCACVELCRCIQYVAHPGRAIECIDTLADTSNDMFAFRESWDDMNIDFACLRFLVWCVWCRG